MKKFIDKYFLGTSRYFFIFFLFGCAVLAIGVSIAWSVKLGLSGAIAYFVFVVLLVGALLKSYNIRLKKRQIKRNHHGKP